MLEIQNTEQHFRTCVDILASRGWTLYEPFLDNDMWRAEATKDNETVCAESADKWYAVQRCMELAS